MYKPLMLLIAVAAIGKQLTDQLNTIAALHKGDVGENLARLGGVQSTIDQKLEAIVRDIYTYIHIYIYIFRPCGIN